MTQSLATQNVAHGTAVTAISGSSLEMQDLKPFPKTTEPECAFIEMCGLEESSGCGERTEIETEKDEKGTHIGKGSNGLVKWSKEQKNKMTTQNAMPLGGGGWEWMAEAWPTGSPS